MSKEFLIRIFKIALVVGFALSLAMTAWGQGERPIDPATPAGLTPDQIIQKFAAKEKEFKKARENYIYRETVKVQTLDGDTVDGEYQQVVDVTFDDKGRRMENVIFAPQPTLVRIGMSREDFDDIQNRLPFVLSSDDVAQYNIRYVGQQHVDELDTYMFDVEPKILEKGKRYFQGRIWVDNRDFQIVKTSGKTVPDIRSTKKRAVEENLFPSFTTYREQIDGKYWFPTYTRADDTLHFSNQDVKMRVIIKYSDYQRFNTNVQEKVTFGGQQVPTKPAESKETPKSEDPK